MATCKQSALRKRKFRKPGLKYKNPVMSRTPILKRSPQVKGIVTRVVTMSPKKPNSANRRVAKVKIAQTLDQITIKIPGENHNLQQHSTVLVRGGRTRDLIGVKLKAIRGKYDLSGVSKRKTSRSKYGVKTL